MESRNEHGRLVVFTVGPSADAMRRHLLPARARRAEIAFHANCLAEAIDAGRGAGCAVTLCSPRAIDVAGGVDWLSQADGSFGDRLRAVFRVADDGAPLLVVGSDTPGLSAAHVRSALEALEDDVVVLGPSPDGGVYLIASASPIDEVLAPVRWRSRWTFRDLHRAALRAGKRVVVLEPLGDIDHRADLDRWLADRVELARWTAIRTLLLDVLQRLRRCEHAPQITARSESAIDCRGIRPPPRIATV